MLHVVGAIQIRLVRNPRLCTPAGRGLFDRKIVVSIETTIAIFFVLSFRSLDPRCNSFVGGGAFLYGDFLTPGFLYIPNSMISEAVGPEIRLVGNFL